MRMFCCVLLALAFWVIYEESAEARCRGSAAARRQVRQAHRASSAPCR